MSSYVAKAFNPVSKLIEDATYVDDYYGRHKYGIRFDDGCVHPYAHCGLDAAATALTARDKEIEALMEEIKGLNEESDLLADMHVRAEARAETAERERDEARAALKPFTAYSVGKIERGKDFDYCIHVLCPLSSDQPMFKHFDAARAVINKGE